MAEHRKRISVTSEHRKMDIARKNCPNTDYGQNLLPVRVCRPWILEISSVKIIDTSYFLKTHYGYN
jgi:hypothetical protein